MFACLVIVCLPGYCLLFVAIVVIVIVIVGIVIVIVIVIAVIRLFAVVVACYGQVAANIVVRVCLCLFSVFLLVGLFVFV